MLNNQKVSVIGTGNVGTAIAYQLAMRNLCRQVVLIGRTYDKAKGKALDITQASATIQSTTQVLGSASFSDMKDSKIVIITSGSPRKPGMSRDDLLISNADITKDLAHKVKEFAPESIVIAVANPLDAMTYVVFRETGFPRERVLGMAGVLDSSRMEALIAQKTGMGCGQVQAIVLGGHGDEMVPLPRFSTVNGVSVQELLSKKTIDQVIEKTRRGGAQIVDLLGTSGYFAPANSAVVMAEAILRNSEALLPCAVLLDGEYGYHDVVTGVPIVLGADGMKDIIEFSLNEKEKEAFKRSIATVQSMLNILEKQNFYEYA
ncbi:malate dehydrogenase [Sulfurospirillum arcachonense]|uniref:malate dehydrogenase n=1 Tax=Sulfurospirillum arcachonense TaxID=57666 RepID=UPI00046ABECC|nr:malate dehydrogenase [Sulfurospirillum arcachonense]